MVLLGHARGSLPTSVTENVFFKLISNSSLGVSIFFVISGYLITRLLIRERVETGSINIKDFYKRRVYRIFPVFYLYIFVVLLLKWFYLHDIFTDYSLVTYAGLYLWNYKHLFSTFGPDNGFWFFGHFWSLSMEEQFYMVWPWFSGAFMFLLRFLAFWTRDPWCTLEHCLIRSIFGSNYFWQTYIALGRISFHKTYYWCL